MPLRFGIPLSHVTGKPLNTVLLPCYVLKTLDRFIVIRRGPQRQCEL